MSPALPLAAMIVREVLKGFCWVKAAATGFVWIQYKPSSRTVSYHAWPAYQDRIGEIKKALRLLTTLWLDTSSLPSLQSNQSCSPPPQYQWIKLADICMVYHARCYFTLADNVMHSSSVFWDTLFHIVWYLWLTKPSVLNMVNLSSERSIFQASWGW